MDNYTATEEAFKNGYEKGKQDAMKWISVKERLPIREGISENVIVHTIDGDVTTGWVEAHTRDTWWLVIGEDDYHSEHKGEYVTHWMPLPEPPKENDYDRGRISKKT